VQALLACNGYNPEKALDMSVAEIDSHLTSIAKIRGGKPQAQGDSTSRKFKGHRKNKPS